jgi:acyl-CoA thioesterase FadM
VVATCTLDRLGRSSVHTAEEIRTTAGEVAARAGSVMVPRDRTTGSARRLTDAEREALTR